ncbi:PilT protein domain protein [Candidatus Burkholderia pumila]|uniref:PilT protein domain protein n=1 Tax=Candidatus Burkholderia pumila TaxID=1090375 RepID=A0ABR5HL93_9BURK|nr:PilT protein domain protein [Candidatus Burkholderia pumila]
MVLDRPDFQVEPRLLRRRLLRRNLLDNGYEELPVLSAHVMALEGLPPIHRDPFDRLAGRPGDRRRRHAAHPMTMRWPATSARSGTSDMEACDRVTWQSPPAGRRSGSCLHNH